MRAYVKVSHLQRQDIREVPGNSAVIRICLCICIVLCIGSLICLHLWDKTTHTHLSAPLRRTLTSCSAAKTLSLLARWTRADAESATEIERESNRGGLIPAERKRWSVCALCGYSMCVCVWPAEVKVEWERQCVFSVEYSYHCCWMLQLINPGHTGPHCVCVCADICRCVCVKYLLCDCEVCQDLYLHQRDARTCTHTHAYSLILSCVRC